MIGESVTVHHPTGGGGIGTDGEPIAETFTTEVIAKCAVAPGSTSEDLNRQSTVKVEFTVYLPAGSVVESGARMTVRGEVFEVDGAAKVWVNPHTDRRPGVEVALVRSS